jgi:sulfate ABC transporter permease protein CysT
VNSNEIKQYREKDGYKGKYNDNEGKTAEKNTKVSTGKEKACKGSAYNSGLWSDYGNYSYHAFAFDTDTSCVGYAQGIFLKSVRVLGAYHNQGGFKCTGNKLELPFALPTAVAGITLSKMYSDTGMIGKYLAKLGIKVSYTKIGIVIALVFVGIPFVVRAIQPILENLDSEYEEASFIMGASKATTFRRVILPELRPALLTGFGLAFARGVGEYGSVIYISGNSAREHTQVISYVIMQKLNYIDYASATAIALVMLVFSFLILLFINIVQVRQSKRTNNV